MEWVVSFLISLIVSALIIWIVGRLGLGLEVASFGSAIAAAFIIAIIDLLLALVFRGAGVTLPASGLIGAIINIIVAAFVLMIAARLLPGMRVNGFLGAIIAAIAIGVIAWIVTVILGAAGVRVGGLFLP